MKEDGNGEKSPEQMAKEKLFAGIEVGSGELRRQDGLIAESLDKAGHRNLGVIQTTITAEQDDKNYRQILIRGRWRSREEMDKGANALAVCDICGARKARQYLLDRFTIHTAGQDGAAIHDALEALTHTTFITENKQKKKWYQGGDRNGNRSSSSPIT